MVYIENIAATVRPAFTAKVKEVSTALGIRPDWLMTVMYAESKVNHKAVNAASGATGLIQFLPSTASGLGTSTAALKNMTAVEQLFYVQKYFAPYKAKLNSVYETYLAVFYPAALGKSDSYVLFSKGSTAYTNNRALDVDGDGKVTKKDVKSWFSKYVKVDTSNTLLYAGLGLLAFVIIKRNAETE